MKPELSTLFDLGQTRQRLKHEIRPSIMDTWSEKVHRLVAVGIFDDCTKMV